MLKTLLLHPQTLLENLSLIILYPLSALNIIKLELLNTPAELK